MCGISGIALHASASSDKLEYAINAMTDQMLHRGPDDGGAWIAPTWRAAIGSRRLAIRDLSPAGHMPIRNDDGSVWMVYNGEVYNSDDLRPELEALGYNFRSTNDTEVILRGYEAWGEAVVDRLRGMFAFAIYDERDQHTHPRLFLARDRLGIKPIYYAPTAHGFAFASELNSLVASGQISTDLDPAGIAAYLLLGSLPAPTTIYRDVYALPPAHTLTVTLAPTLQVAAPRPYWRMPDHSTPLSESDAVDRVRSLLEEAVRIRLVADVPLGAFLSGGLDSSAIVALMRKTTNSTLRTCSIVFDEAEYSEASYAKAVADSVGAEHQERLITSAEVINGLPAIFGAMDQPTIDGVNTYFVSQTARQAGLTVALSGLGGDELFGGYANTFAQVPRVMRALQMAHRFPLGVPAAQTAIRVMPDVARWGRMQDALDRPVSYASAYLTRRGLFAPREVRQLVSPEVWREATQRFDAVAHIAERADAPAADSFLWVSRAELSTYTHHQLLRDTDVMSMAHSLEVRVPFLDHKLVEAVLALPTATKLNGNTPKPLLVKAIGDLLPTVVRERRSKQGFTFPFDRWLKGDLGKQLDPTREGALPFMRRDGVQHVWSQYQAGKLHWSRAWALVALEQWHRHRPT